MSRAAEKIIVALDCDEQQARALAAQLAGQVKWLKVGMTLYYQAGPALVRELKQWGFKVFVDLKLHDIPHQVRGAAAAVAAAGADLLTVHAAGGLEMMAAALEGALEGARKCVCDDALEGAKEGVRKGTHEGALEGAKEAPAVIAVTVLTSLDAKSLNTIGVAASTVDNQVLRLARLAREAGLDGVVSSPREAALLRRELGPQALVVCPGIRPQSVADDQKRVATPQQALSDGASYLVVGRPITEAPHPRAAFEALVAELDPIK